MAVDIAKNGRNNDFPGGPATPLAAGDPLAIHTPVGGGEHSKSVSPANAPDEALCAFYGWHLLHL
jgi:hypothetical protein